MKAIDFSKVAASVQLERSILGGLLLRADLLSSLALEVDDFFDPRHKAVFAAMRAIDGRNDPLDVALVAAELERAGTLEAVGGFAFLGDLALHVPLPDNVEHYAREVRQHTITRRTLIACGQAPQYVEGGTRGEELLDEVMGELSRIDRPDAERDLTIASVVDGEMAAINRFVSGEETEADLPRLPWGISSLDEETGGVPMSLLTIIGARPGVGKTTLLINFALRTTAPGIIFTNEDDPEGDLAQCFLAWEARLDSRRIRDRAITEIERVDLEAARERLKRTSVKLVPAHGMTWLEMRRRVLSAKTKMGARWFGVDYLQNMPGTQGVQRTYQIQEIVQGFQTLAGQHNLAGLLTSQLSREAVKDQGGPGQRGAKPKVRRPALQDFRDSGAIEQCGKLILALHPNPDKPPDQIEALVLKHRRGKNRRIVDLLCQPEYSRLDSLPLNRIATPPPSSWEEAPMPEAPPWMK